MNYTYIVIKPDGIPLLSIICDELSAHDIDIVKKYKVDHFDDLSIPLYLDSEAIERGNAPIIIGINNIFKQKYGTTAIILLLNSKRHESKEEFIVRVCALKKTLRKKYIGGYRAYEGTVAIEDYLKYGVHFSEKLAMKRCISKDSNGKKYYMFQINSIHSPDNIDAYNREIKVLQEYGAFNNPL